MENSILPSIPVMTVDQITQSEGFLNKSQLEKLYLFEETQGILGETHSERLLNAEIIDDDKVEEIQFVISTFMITIIVIIFRREACRKQNQKNIL